MIERAENIKIRVYHSSDCFEIAKLFYDTVHSINAKDYSQDEINSWATGEINIKEWDKSFLSHYTIIAVDSNDTILGFGDIDNSGYLDKLYVHKDFQNIGIATAICDELERHCTKTSITTHASITAKPFFQKRGYILITEQQVERRGVKLINYVMKKNLKSIIKDK